MSAVFEKSFFFTGSQGRNLYGFLHGVQTGQAKIGLIYCHPFAEEKNMSHSVVVKTSRMLAGSGFPVLRFDFSGCGDSQGSLADVSVEAWQDDLRAAIEFFKEETGATHYIIWGLGLGAGIALLHASQDEGVAGLLLWQPVFDFSLHLKQFLRRVISSEISNERSQSAPTEKVESKLINNEEISVIGYPITKQLYESFNNVGSYPSKIIPTVPTFILSVSLMDETTTAMKRYAAMTLERGSQVTLHHIKAEPFWDRYWCWEQDEATEATLNWLLGGK